MKSLCPQFASRSCQAKALTFWVILLREECGQDLIEYALVGALVALGAVASMRTLAASIGSAFGHVGTTLSSTI